MTKLENLIDKQLLTSYHDSLITNVVEPLKNEAVSSAMNVSYAQLVQMRTQGTLKAGQYYRITDYVTTTTQTDTQSAGHQFDVIVRADSSNVLNENAWAALHSGDEYFSTAGAKLEAWKLKYCLDNDTTNFEWADATNGKGIIWWMKDEFDNECPYDFKNIQFRWSSNISQSGIVANLFYYTFSVTSNNITSDNSFNGNYCYSNTIEKRIINYKKSLNFIVFKNNPSYLNCYSNAFGDNCYNNTFGYNCYNNTFGDNCYNNKFGDNCHNNTFGYDCHNNTFDNYCRNNVFGNSCYNNVFGNSCYNNIFEYDCLYNTFGNYCYNNVFGKSFINNVFGNSCYFNTLGYNCHDNRLYICLHNMFGDDCSYLTKENFSKHTIESLDKSTHINKAKEFFFDTDEIYQNKDKSIYPVSHPDLSTQPSILPQRFGNLPINEILIAKGREDEIPSDAMVISAFSFNAKECCPATVKYMQPEGLSASWSITNEQGVDPEFTLIQYVGADVGYYYTNVDKNYLEFVITGRSGVISFNSSDINNILQYSKDGGSTWDTVSGDIQVFYGDRIMWKGLMSPVGPNGVGTFAGNVEYDVQGNVMSLLYGDDFIGKTSLEGKDYVFASLFGNNKLVSAKNLILPATTLSNSCYSSMFTSCTSLTEAPQLPATTLAEGCYTNMFQGCTILTTAPKLPANTLVYFCYVGMFRYCTNLNLITCLATNISADCTNQWVDGVAASGTFTKAPSMTSWPNGINGIPNGWTINNF